MLYGDNMQEVFTYGKRYWYPHLTQDHISIWEKFIAEFPDAYDYCQYDLEIGQIPDFVTGHDDQRMRGQANLYQRKIDVVGFKGDQIDLIEIKPHAGLSSLGQINGYKALYQRDFSPAVVPKAIVVTDRIDDDVAHAAYAQGVQIIVV